MIEPLLASVGSPAYRRARPGRLARRRTARPDSSIDLLLLAEDPTSSREMRPGRAPFGEASNVEVEDWGRVTSLRTGYTSGQEVELAKA